MMAAICAATSNQGFSPCNAAELDHVLQAIRLTPANSTAAVLDFDSAIGTLNLGNIMMWSIIKSVTRKGQDVGSSVLRRALPFDYMEEGGLTSHDLRSSAMRALNEMNDYRTSRHKSYCASVYRTSAARIMAMQARAKGGQLEASAEPPWMGWFAGCSPRYAESLAEQAVKTWNQACIREGGAYTELWQAATLDRWERPVEVTVGGLVMLRTHIEKLMRDLQNAGADVRLVSALPLPMLRGAMRGLGLDPDTVTLMGSEPQLDIDFDLTGQLSEAPDKAAWLRSIYKPVALAVGASDLIRAAPQAKLRVQIGGVHADTEVLYQGVEEKTGQLSRGVV